MNKKRVIDFRKYDKIIRKIGITVAFFFLIAAFVLIIFAEFNVDEIQAIENIAYASLCLGFFNLMFLALFVDKMNEESPREDR